MRSRQTSRRRRLYEESDVESVSVVDKMTGSTRLSLDSVDDQIDSYIIKLLPLQMMRLLSPKTAQR